MNNLSRLPGPKFWRAVGTAFAPGLHVMALADFPKLLGFLKLLLVSSLLLGLGSCATMPRAIPAADAAIYHKAQVDGFHNIRSWGDELPPFMDEVIAQNREILRVNPARGKRNDLLALSGGGADGAYGAGFLKGWTERGDRPEFALVTGVSTGALMAPFAFLGSEYDPVLRRFYTETHTSGILNSNIISLLFGGTAAGDSTPLRRRIEKEINAKVIQALARESRRGRTLLIGTTDLDAQRQVIWNIGKIAESGHPGAAKLIHKILLASASIPGVFPPVNFDVVIDGKRYQELHVDGGVTHGVFAYPSSIRVKEIERRLGISPRNTMWLIRNNKILAAYDPVKENAASIAGRSLDTLLKYQGRGDLLDIERLARRDGFHFRLTSVPEEFNEPSSELFDPVYMKALYEVGYRKGRSGAGWRYGLGSNFTLKPIVRGQ